MSTFEITPSGSEAHFEPFTVEAADYEDAAQKATRTLNRPGSSHAMRVTGIFGKSGVFQGYRYLSRGHQESSVGSNFHISRLN